MSEFSSYGNINPNPCSDDLIVESKRVWGELNKYNYADVFLRRCASAVIHIYIEALIGLMSYPEIGSEYIEINYAEFKNLFGGENER